MIVARSPLRISFGGGGTDLPAYYERYGGLVVSAAIGAACHAQITPRRGRGVVIESKDYQQTIAVPCQGPVTVQEPLPLQRAVLAWFEAQGLRPEGIQLTVWADVPPGSGLGSSSAMTAALVCAIARHVRLPLTQRMVAGIACEIEIDLLGRPIGRQDQYASALGGLNRIAFSRDGVDVTPVPLSPAARRSLQEHLLLVSTRRTRDSASVLRAQRDASGTDGDVTRRLHRIRSLAEAMCDALLAGDLPSFGALLDESWQLKRGLASGVTSDEIDRWYEIARRGGAYGGKISGAGGGGFFLFCVPPRQRQRVITALQEEGLEPFPVTFDDRGCMARDEMVVVAPRSRPSLKGFLHEAANASQL
jgi:D-glycero-alpha-D-manno-heptose-7-phosphate kinase